MLQVRLLGTYEVFLKDRPIDLSSRPAQSLLAYLLLNPNQPVRREKLAGLIWPDSTESNARSSLRHALWRVRKSLDSDGDAYLHADDLTISLQLQKDDWVDVNILEPHIQDDISTDALIEIVSVYGGELLPGFYEDWVFAERERLKTVFEGKMDLLLDRLVAESRWEEAVRWGERWISLGFTPEHAYRAMMIAHAGLGDIGKAAAVYERCVLALESDLGVQPSRQTREIYQGLMAGTLRDVLPLARDKLAPRGYKLLEQIGAGSFGAVYRAHHPEVGREVAIKVILPQYANDPDFIRRFETEAQIVARLEHPHIVPLYDYWREPDSAYLVMRYLRAGSLASLLEHGPLDLEAVLTLVDQLAAALAAAHQEGIVHRDIKPGNILLDEARNYYLSDFGIAKDISVDPQASSTGGIKGSPLYTSPEQLLGEPVTPRSDIYSLGLVLYQALSGELPYSNDSIAALIERQLHQPLPPLSELRTEVPQELDQVIQRATAKQSADRFKDSLEFAEAFRSALAGISLPFVQIPVEATLKNPYKGLLAFQEADAADFFGRDAMVQRLLNRLNSVGKSASGNENDPGAGRFLAVVGPSGSGKSSLVKAGLIPAIRQGMLPGSDNWFIVEMTPGTHPMEELEAALLRVAVNPPASLLAQLNESQRGLVRGVKRVLPGGDEAELLLVIDQFEELFTMSEEEVEIRFFLDSLFAAATDPRGRVRIVISLRADFLDRPLMHSDFSQVVRNCTEMIVPLTTDELVQAIQQPVRGSGLSFEEGLIPIILGELNQQPGALPLMQYALTELFERRQGQALTREAYLEIGGVQGALGSRAEESYARLNEAERAAARQLFMRLVTLGEGVEDTRRRALRSELEAIHLDSTEVSMAQVIDAFGRARLLSFDRDPATRGPTVEVAHEALLREWRRLREWLDESRADVRMQRVLANAAAEWLNADEDSSFLLRGSRLDQFESWHMQTGLALTTIERQYLQASLAEQKAHREAEAAQKAREVALERRSRNFLRVLVGVFALATIIAITLTIFAFTQRDLATARELASSARSEMDVDPERSILLTLQSLKITYTSEAEDSLRAALQTSRARLTIPAHQAEVCSVAFSPDGSRLASVSWDGTWKAWDPVTGKQLLSIEIARGEPYECPDLAFNPQGDQLAVGIPDGSLKIWDPETGELQRTLTGHTSWFNRVAFSPDGSTLVSANTDGTVRLWDPATGELRFAVKAKSTTIGWDSDVDFVAGGRYLLIVESHANGRFIDLATGETIFRLPPGLFWGVTVTSNDGKLLVTGDHDFNGVKLYDLQALLENRTDQPLFNLGAPGSVVPSKAFSSDSKFLATGSFDSTSRVWAVNSEGGQELMALMGHEGIILDLSFSPDHKSLATASGDGTIKVWDITPEGSRELLTRLSHEDQIWSMTFSPDGTLFATASFDGTARIWRADSGDLVHKLSGHQGEVHGVSFSPDGARLATSGGDNTVRIWDVRSGQELRTLTGHELAPNNYDIASLIPGVLAVAYSPDGNLLASVGEDGTARIWDSERGDLLRTLILHPQRHGGVNVTFSPDGARLAVVTDLHGPGPELGALLKVWDVKTWQETLSIDLPDRGRGLDFSPDGAQLVTTGFGGYVIVWDPLTGQRLYSLTSADTDEIGDAAFSPDGSRLVISGPVGARVWDLNSRTELFTLAGHKRGVSAVAFNPEGARIATAGFDGVVRVYTTDIDELIGIAESRLTRWFTQEECQRFLHTDTCPPPP
jgi:WD40 repeat protein/serine/threonine protein kinase/DNA-binding SARP family transcriptional activator